MGMGSWSLGQGATLQNYNNELVKSIEAGYGTQMHSNPRNQDVRFLQRIESAISFQSILSHHKLTGLW